MIHHTWAAPHVAEDNDGDRAKFWRPFDILECPNCEKDEQERHEDGDDSECLGHCMKREGCDDVMLGSLFTPTMASRLVSSSLRATTRTSVQPRRYLDSALRSWLRFVSSAPQRRAVHRGSTPATASNIYAPKRAPAPSVNPPHSKCHDQYSLVSLNSFQRAPCSFRPRPRRTKIPSNSFLVFP